MDDISYSSTSKNDFHYSNRYSDDDIYYDIYDEEDKKESFPLYTYLHSYFKSYIQFINRHYFAIDFSLLLVVAFITLYSNNLIFSKPNLETSTAVSATMDKSSDSNIADDDVKDQKPPENKSKMAIDGQHP